MFSSAIAVAAMLCAGANAAAVNATSTSPSSPIASGDQWKAAFAKASTFVSQLTLDEKVRLVTGNSGPCEGNIGPIDRLGFEGLCLQDGPVGLRLAALTSTFSAGLSVGASWDRSLANVRGLQMGAEFAGKGVNVAYGPVVGPLGRSAFDGRWWEGFSTDPYLSGELVDVTIQGMQTSGVQACVKHYMLNEQDTQRTPTINSVTGALIESVSSDVDDRTTHELYLWPFANAVKSGVSAVMCSYNSVNGSYSCQNSHVLNELLKTELDFQGFVLSDYGATHSGVASILAGLDMDMPGGIYSLGVPTPSFFGANVTLAVNNGSVPIARLDDMARRIMTPYFQLKQKKKVAKIDPSEATLGFFGPPPYPYQYNMGHTVVDVRADHAKSIQELGAAGLVLLKNTNGVLPLKQPKQLGVFGAGAGDVQFGAAVNPGPGSLPTGGGSGAGGLQAPLSPLTAIHMRAAQDGTNVQFILDDATVAGPLSYDYYGFSFYAGLGTIVPVPDVCLLFLKLFNAEGSDRSSLYADNYSNETVQTVSSYCSKTVVITNAAGLTLMPWANNPNVTAIIAAHLRGQEIGQSIVDVLYGDYNPSGKLPYTIALTQSDYDFAPIANSTALQQTTNATAWVSTFSEGLLTDYRHFDYYNLPVQYEFGYGLSYTTFDLSGVSVTASSQATIAAQSTGSVSPGGRDDLWETLYTVTATVKNTGKVAGATVAQLYVSLPAVANSIPTPKQVLRGFEKVTLNPGASAQVTMPLMRRDLSYWSVELQNWVIPSGQIGLGVGFSSRQIMATRQVNPVQ